MEDDSLQENDEDENEEIEFVYGIPMPTITDTIQPLECLILVRGIVMETGMPTVTSMGSRGITPWDALGMLEMEAARIKMTSALHSVAIDKIEDEE